jgi:hypothetical protein
VSHFGAAPIGWSVALLLHVVDCGTQCVDVPGPDCQRYECSTLCGEICDNGVDDDANGNVDCDDSACRAECTESCLNGRDDDGDGAIDCGDPDCFGAANACDVERDCADGEDNDDDGYVDAADDDCEATPWRLWAGIPSKAVTPPDVESP